jgi:hypothetical protein
MRWLLLLGMYAAGAWAVRELSQWWKDSKGKQAGGSKKTDVQGTPKKSEPYDKEKVVDATYREVEKEDE